MRLYGYEPSDTTVHKEKKSDSLISYKIFQKRIKIKTGIALKVILKFLKMQSIK